MRLRSILTVVLLLVAVFASAQEKKEEKPLNVAGVWDMTVQSPNGTGSRVLRLRQQGEELTGDYEGQMGGGPITGNLKGNKIYFSVTLAVEGNSMVIRYAGVVEGEKISGEVDFGDYGSGTWTATKRKS